jgi:DMSO/TMAO reductase YedYZ molybdopterin-dependent catalytic subunit
MTGDARNQQEAERERRLRELTDDGEIISADEYRRRSRRAFLSFGALGVAGYVGFNQLQSMGSRENDNIPAALRTGLEWNQAVWQTIERDGATARTFSQSRREDIRVNGWHGLRATSGASAEADLIQVSAEEAAAWEISMTGVDGKALDSIPLASIKSDFEVHDMVWEHKCVEGWANIVHWTGVRVSDVLEQYAPDQLDAAWGVMRTPESTDGGQQEREYSAAIDRYTLRHSQSLFAWRLNGEDLDNGHGAPLRLATPMKYGIKQIKRIGSIEFTNDTPGDYWTDRGYDLHAGF